MSAASPSLSAPQVLGKIIDLLRKVPAGDRANFARSQLSRTYPGLVAAFDAIPKERRNRTVLFASVTPHFRETRLAAAARLAGWDVLMACDGVPKYEPRDYFSYHVVVTDRITLLLACWLFPGALIHAFALRGDELALFDVLKPDRLVIDLYDTCADLLAPKPEAAQERQLIARADGIVHRDVRIKRLQKIRGYSLPPHNILVHDPLPECTEPPATRVRDRGEIRIVSVGWIGSGANSILRVAESFASHGIHLHIYLSHFQQGRRPETEPYLQLQGRSRFIHIENPVFGEAYLRALREYDFGLAVAEPAIFGETMPNFTTEAIAGCGSSRLSDYILCDLGVIVSPELKFQHFWARHYAAATVPATTAFLRNPRPALERALEQKANRKPVDRSRITVQGTAKRLGEFYAKVAA